MNLFTVQGHNGSMNYNYYCHWICMTCHTTTLRIFYVSVVYQLDRKWCPLSLGMSTFVIMLLVRMMHVRVHINETVICDLYRHWLRWFLLNLSIGSIQQGVTGRRLRVTRNFLSKFEEKVTILGRWWCTKESKRCVKNIWRCHRVEFLGQSRESWMRLAVIRQRTDRIIMRWHWHTGDKIVDGILMDDFGIYFIMICYSSLLSQDMSYGIGVR
jgi:hypothetical protein